MEVQGEDAWVLASLESHLTRSAWGRFPPIRQLLLSLGPDIAVRHANTLLTKLHQLGYFVFHKDPVTVLHGGAAIRYGFIYLPSLNNQDGLGAEDKLTRSWLSFWFQSTTWR
eukprot:GHVU01176543.1.p4 GENE.GHVU01176543.1~~GHVU01176543.1.p4  ORF type:complete len:112 (-),score=8.98 GHVU01176543.1:356-691(-)